MTRIRANCPSCGEVDLCADDVTLRIVRSPDGEVDDASTYRFDCPDCAELVTKPADGRIAQLLSSGGVPTEETTLAEHIAPVDRRPPHPEDPPGGRGFTHDDLLDLHLLLASDGWFDRLLTLTWPVASP